MLYQLVLPEKSLLLKIFLIAYKHIATFKNEHDYCSHVPLTDKYVDATLIMVDPGLQETVQNLYKSQAVRLMSTM